MIPSIDYLTLVLAGVVLFHYGIEAPEAGKLDIIVTFAGVFLFVVGVGRALMGAFGL